MNTEEIRHHSCCQAANVQRIRIVIKWQRICFVKTPSLIRRWWGKTTPWAIIDRNFVGLELFVLQIVIVAYHGVVHHSTWWRRWWQRKRVSNHVTTRERRTDLSPPLLLSTWFIMNKVFISILTTRMSSPSLAASDEESSCHCSFNQKMS